DGTLTSLVQCPLSPFNYAIRLLTCCLTLDSAKYAKIARFPWVIHGAHMFGWPICHLPTGLLTRTSSGEALCFSSQFQLPAVPRNSSVSARLEMWPEDRSLLWVQLSGAGGCKITHPANRPSGV